MVDGEGYVHVSFDHHGHKLNYCRSIAPGSLELGDKIPMTGVDEGNVTYPEFYSLSGGDLLFVYRSGSSGRGNLVMNRYSLKEHISWFVSTCQLSRHTHERWMVPFSSTYICQ